MPTLRGCVGSSTGAGTSATVTATLPTGIVAGDFILLFCGAGTTATSATATGFTAVTATDSGSRTLTFLYKTATGTEGSSVTVTFAGSHAEAVVACAYGGVSGFDPTPTSSGQLNASSGTITVPGVTTTNNGDQLVWFGYTSIGSGGTPAAITKPTGFTAQMTQVKTTHGGSATNVGVIMADATQATAGATGNENGTVATAEVNGGLLIALSGASTESGSLNLSLPALNSSLAGTVTHQGGLAPALPRPATSLSGVVAHIGSLALSLPTLTVSLSGLVTPPGTAVALDAVSHSAAALTALPLTWTHAGGSGLSEVLVGFSFNSNRSVSAITYGGNTMTLVDAADVNASAGVDGWVFTYRLASPPSGSQTVSITPSGACDMIGGAMTFTGSSGLGTPVHASNVHNSAGDTASTVVLPGSTSGSLIHMNNASGSPQVSSGTAPATLRWFDNLNSNSAAGNGGGVTSPGTGSSVTVVQGHGKDWWGAVAVEVLPAGAGSTESGSFSVSLPKPATSLSGSVSSPGTESGGFTLTLPAPQV